MFRVVENTNMFRVIQNTIMFKMVQNTIMFRVAQNINKDTSFTKAQTYHPTQKQNENEEEAKTSTKPYYTACFMTCHLA